MWRATFELNRQENLWDEIREKIFKNYALKSMDEVRNPALVKSITSFPLHRQVILI
jgi:hypothetical protein